MDKEKFSYEVKDFKPALRKKGIPAPLLALLSILCAAAVIFAVIKWHRAYIKKQLEPDEVVRLAVIDTVAEIFGRESALVKGMALEEWYDLYKDGVIDIGLDLRLKSISDELLEEDISKYASGIRLAFDSSLDAKNRKLSGNIKGSWTVVSFNLLQYAYDGEGLYVSSKDFFKETFMLKKADLPIYVRLKDVAKKYLVYVLNDRDVEYLENLDISDVSLMDIFEMLRLSGKYEKTGEVKTFSAGRNKERECECYRVTGTSPSLPHPITAEIYIDRDMRIVNASVKYEGDTKFEIEFDFLGEDRLTDKSKVSLNITTKEGRTISGGLDTLVEHNKEEMTVKNEGSIDVFGLKLNGRMFTDVDFTDGTFTVKFTGDDEVSTAETETTGKIEVDREKLRFKFEDVRVKFLGRELGNLSASVKITESEKDRSSLGSHPSDNIIDVRTLVRENIDAVKDQILNKIDEYVKAFADFTFL